MRLSRRYFLRSGGIALVGVGSALATLPQFLTRAGAALQARGKTLVVVFQRGAADGLNIVVPHGEKAYYSMRPSIAIPRPGRGSPDRALDLDGQFGLHPSLGAFRELYRRKMLAVVHAAGSPNATRSHFDAQDFMESGTPGIKSTADGWLNRYLQSHATRGPVPFRAVSITQQLPRILAGPARALAVPELSRFGFEERRLSALALGALREVYGRSADPLVAPAGREALEAVDRLERLDPGRYRPAPGVDYPTDAFGRSLLQIAQLIKARVGVEIAFTDIGGWDHHVNEGGVQGSLSNLLRRFSAGIDAFVRDLGERMADVVLVTLSEFGRTARENGNRGTDHGHANAMFVLGGPVHGGRLYGKWPGLAREHLHEGRDLARTTDFRDVLGELLVRHLGAERLGPVFPGHVVDPAKFKGLA